MSATLLALDPPRRPCTPGAHHDVLAASGLDIVHARGSGVTWREATKYLPAAARWRVAGSWLSPSSRPARALPDGRTTYGDGQVTVPLMVLNIPDEPSSVGTFANVAVTVAPETVATSWPPVA